MAYRVLPKFDPSARYLAVRAMALDGAQLKSGDEVPATVPARCLRQLYETRRVRPRPATAKKAGRAGEKGK